MSKKRTWAESRVTAIYDGAVFTETVGSGAVECPECYHYMRSVMILYFTCRYDGLRYRADICPAGHVVITQQ